MPVCGASPCYQSYGILGMWEFTVNTTAPILLEGLFSIGLVLRVQWQKRRLHQSTQWHKQRRMIIQLLLISFLNVNLNLPIYLIPLAHLCGLPPEYGVQAELHFFFLDYFVVFLFLFASLSQFPDLRKKLKKETTLYGIKTTTPLSHVYTWINRDVIGQNVMIQLET